MLEDSVQTHTSEIAGADPYGPVLQDQIQEGGKYLAAASAADKLTSFM